MSDSERSTSPDPLTQPESPLASRTRSNVGRRTNRALARRSHNVVSPSKSIVMDTGKSVDGSPWRIKVTVEAEPKDGNSPARRATRTSKIALKAATSSPAKRSNMKKKTIASDESEVEASQRQRKRKGTPIRRVARRSQTLETLDSEDAVTSGSGTGGIEMSAKLQEELSSPTKRPYIRSGRKTVSRQGTHEPSEGRTSHDEHESEQDSDIVKPAYEYEDMTVANEDFTMVSVDTLQSMKQNTSMLEDSRMEKSVASVSYLPSSPPSRRDAASEGPKEASYPSISKQVEEAKSIFGGSVRKPVIEQVEHGHEKSKTYLLHQSQPKDSNLVHSKLQRQAVTRRVEHASASQAMFDEAETHLGAQDDQIEDEAEDHPAQANDELDIWAEEASRSLEEVEVQPLRSQIDQQESRQPQLGDLFSDQPMKPARPKIPRTWRRTSGMDFSYVDSPEHGTLQDRKASGTSTDGEAVGSRSSGGVLTPPESSDDDSIKPTADEEANEAIDEGDTSLTQPDAAATQLQDCHEDSPRNTRDAASLQAEVMSPFSDSSSSVTSPEGDDTGLFWQNNLPSLYQRPVRPRMAQRQKAMDLSELLNLDQTVEPKEPTHKQSTVAGREAATTREIDTSYLRKPYVPRSRREAAAQTSAVESSSRTAGKVVSSPLRRSLLKSSKVGGTTLPTSTAQSDSYSRARRDHVPAVGHSSRERIQADTRAAKSIVGQQSKDEHDSAPTLQFNSVRQRGSSLRYEHKREEVVTAEFNLIQEDGNAKKEPEIEQDASYLDVTNPTQDSIRSYEENLNLESPQKIRVQFGDSLNSSSALAPKNSYPSLFGKPEESERSPPSVTLVGKKPVSVVTEAQQGIFSRLSSTFWSAVVRPAEQSAIERTPDPIYSSKLRAEIRSRYGVLSDQHPWTMSHMRTLHRLLNSCTSNRYDSIVPKRGPLPSALEKQIGKDTRCVGDFRWTFTEQHAHVADAFMQTLVPAHYIEAMRNGEVDFIGDSEAKKYRGLIQGRHGDDLVFKEFFWIQPQGQITRDFVIRAVGNCVSANICTAEKEAAEVAKRRRIFEERRAWEIHNGMIYDDDDVSEVMPRVTRA